MLSSLLEFCFLTQATTRDLVSGTTFCFFSDPRNKILTNLVFLVAYDHSSKMAVYLPETDMVLLAGLGYEQDEFGPDTFLRVYPFSGSSHFYFETYKELFLYPNPKTLREKLAYKIRTVLTSW